MVVSALIVVAALPFAFFVFTASVSEPQTMQINLPASAVSRERPAAVKLTIILYNENGIYAFAGDDIAAGKSYAYEGEGSIRSLIMDTKNKTNADDFLVVIKAAKSATYQNVVHMLDEMTIGEVKRHEMQQINKQEQQLVEKLSAVQ